MMFLEIEMHYLLNEEPQHINCRFDHDFALSISIDFLKLGLV
jgi:hypothetical protein